MHFNEIEIENYKCFWHPTKIKLEKGINIVVGQNNVGKTSILDALSLKFSVAPHINIETFPNPEQPPQNLSVVTATFTISYDELLDLFVRVQGDREFNLPLALEVASSMDKDSRIMQAFDEAEGKLFGNRFFENDHFTFKIERESYGDGDRENWNVPNNAYVSPEYSVAESNEENNQSYIKFKVDQIKRRIKFGKLHQESGSGKKHRSDFLSRIAKEYTRFIFSFRAERIPSEPCPLNKSSNLLPNAANLAEVLDSLNNAQHNKFNDLVRKVLPNVYQVGVRKVDDKNNGRVVIWTDERAIEDDHLGFKLNNCGSGIGQVLAILYVLMTKEPKVILIDEPQSFLHPNAARKLIEIIRVYGKHHQIVIATHSPTIITAAEPSTVALVKQKGSESEIVNIDIQKFKDLQVILGELGGRFSDVFGYDRIIWVEGDTEEICFPKIASKFQPLLGTAILRVQNTGDFDKKNKGDVERIVSIYERLSFANNGLVPTTIDFIFDKETRSEEAIKLLEKLGQRIQNRNCVHFTSKRLYENYLINPKAITAVINDVDEGRETAISIKEVSDWIEKNKTKSEYYENKKLPEKMELWKDEIHGAKFLSNLFSELVQTQGFIYDKKIHSVRLTDWILENSSDDLKDIADVVKKIINT
jgi:predicted ATP-dependent endonuclease of OLD family